MRLKVTSDRICIKADPVERQTTTGLIIPDVVKQKSRTGTVIQVGNKCRYAEEGDRVFYNDGGAEIEFEGNKLLILRDSYIIAKIKGDNLLMQADRVLVKVSPMDKITKGGIFIPDYANYSPSTGMVINKGLECQHIQEGDRVLFGRSAGTVITWKGVEYLIIREADIVGPLVD